MRGAFGASVASAYAAPACFAYLQKFDLAPTNGIINIINVGVAAQHMA